MSEMQKKVTEGHVITTLPDGTSDEWTPGSWYHTPEEYHVYLLSILDIFQPPRKGYTFYPHFAGYGSDIEAYTAMQAMGQTND